MPLYVLTVFDVTDGRTFYGATGCYVGLVGSDATRLLAKGILEAESETEAHQPLSGAEVLTVQEWHAHYRARYPLLGRLVDGACNDGSASVAERPVSMLSEGPAHAAEPGSGNEGTWRVVERRK